MCRGCRRSAVRMLRRPGGPRARADLDTLVIALYCATCSLFPAQERLPRPGRPEKITDNELICLMVAQMLLGQPSDRRFLALAKRRLVHLFPRLPSQSRYNERCRRLAPKHTGVHSHRRAEEKRLRGLTRLSPATVSRDVEYDRLR